MISGQCLEHCEFPWWTVNEMLCHLRVGGGFAAVVAPFVQARHNHPHDYWRFLDGGLKALSAVALTRSNLVRLREQSRFQDALDFLRAKIKRDAVASFKQGDFARQP